MGCHKVKSRVTYLDNAASSWPKPPKVIEAMNRVVLEYSANPGRGSHKMAVQASRELFEARKNLSKLFNINNPNDISFALNATHALNQGIKGFVKPGDHVITTSIEHNSVRRPLEYLQNHKRVEVTYVPADEKGRVSLEKLEKSIQPNTTLFIGSHSSNLLGTILPVQEISDMIKKNDIKLFIDAAQSAGLLTVDVERMGIDLLAFPGHKGLLGPQGTGGLYIHPSLDIEPLLHGGTGSQSEAVEQPTVRPDRYESGTQNTVGIAGLNEGVKFVLNETVDKIHTKEWTLTQRLMQGLMSIKGINILGPALGEEKTGITSFTLEGADPSEVAFILDQSFNIAVRSGYHCTPLSHKTAGTSEQGAIRASVSYFTTEKDIDYCIEAIKQIQDQLN